MHSATDNNATPNEALRQKSTESSPVGNCDPVIENHSRQETLQPTFAQPTKPDDYAPLFNATRFRAPRDKMVQSSSTLPPVPPPRDYTASRNETGQPSSTNHQSLPAGDYASLDRTTISWEVERKHVKIDKVIGKGAFGQVVKATVLDLRGTPGPTVVAVKMLKGNFCLVTSVCGTRIVKKMPNSLSLLCQTFSMAQDSRLHNLLLLIL